MQFDFRILITNKFENKMILFRNIYPLCAAMILSLTLSGCDTSMWNDPHAAETEDLKVLYSNYRERPKHFDPARSFSSNESMFIDQVYEPPLQYHYLKRPYQLEPATLTKMPEVTYWDENGNQLPDDVLDPAYSVYRLELKEGILYQPHPAFARNEDGEFIYYFTSKEEGAKYQRLSDFTQTGTQELIADDYIYQIKRLADPERLAPLRTLLSDYILGMSEFTQWATEQRSDMPKNAWLDLRQRDMIGVEKIDDYHLTIKIKGKYPQLQYWLAFHFFAPVPWQVDRFYHLPGLPERNITLNYHPVGTGAYMMEDHDANMQIVLTRNPNYRDDFYPSTGMPEDKEKGLLSAAGEKLPFIDKYIFRLEKEQIPTWTKFLQGYYDCSGSVRDCSYVIGGDNDQTLDMQGDGIVLTDEMQARGIQLDRVVRPGLYYSGVNMLDPVVGGYGEKARKLRQAIAIAYNLEEYIKVFRNGRANVAMSPIPPGIFGAAQGESGIMETVFDWQDGKPVRKDIEYAKQLLAEAGYPGGRHAETGEPLVLNLDSTTAGVSKATLTWTSKQFAKLGIQFNARLTDFNRFKEKLETGNAQLFSFGWMADYPDPENFLFLLYGGNAQIDSKSGVNSANYKNPEYDRLFDQMRVMPDGPERAEIIKKMQDILSRDMPWFSMWNPLEFNLTHEWFDNYKPHGISKANFKYWDLDPELRAQKRLEWNEANLWPLIISALILLGLIIPGYLAFKRRQTRTIGES